MTDGINFLSKGKSQREQSMNLLNEIKKQLDNCDKNKIIADLGYNNKQTGMIKLNSLLSEDSLERWLNQSGYDLVHTGKTFLIELCCLLDMEENQYKTEIDTVLNKLKLIEEMPQPYIFVNTAFKRKNEPIFVLSLSEHIRRIYPDKIKVFESSDNGLCEAKRLLQDHYIETDGNLPVWGKILNYVYHVRNTKYVLSKDGEVLPDNKNIQESKASLLVNDRDITAFFRSEFEWPSPVDL